MGPLDILQLPEKGGESFDEQLARLRAFVEEGPDDTHRVEQADIDALAELLHRYDALTAPTDQEIHLREMNRRYDAEFVRQTVK